MFMIIKSIGSVLQCLYHINITIERCLKLFDMHVLRILSCITDIENYIIHYIIRYFCYTSNIFVMYFKYTLNISLTSFKFTPYEYDIVLVLSLKVYASKFLNCYRVHFLLLIIQDTTRLEWKLIIRR